MKATQARRSNKLSALIDASRRWKLLIRPELVVRVDVYTRPNQVRVQALFNFSFGPFEGKESSLWSCVCVCSAVNLQLRGLHFAPISNLANQIAGTMQSFHVFCSSIIQCVCVTIVSSCVFVPSCVLGMFLRLN